MTLAECFNHCLQDKVPVLVESKSPIKKQQDNLAEGGTLAVNEIKFSSKDTEYLENLFKNYVNGLVRKVTKRLRCDSSSYSDASI